MIIKNKLSQTILLLAIVSFIALSIKGCKKEEIVIRGCGGTEQERLEETTFLAINTDVGFILLSDEHGVVYACRGEELRKHQDKLIYETLGLTKWNDYDGTWVTTNGTLFLPLLDQLNTGVSTDLIDFETGEFLLVSEPYQPKGITVEIIDSEKNGVLGYGYFIDYQGFKIRQDIIPAAEGIQVFKTKIDAMKIAYFVAYKLKNGIHPSTEPDDLLFFNIDHEY
jgi:hypothetical protein